MWEKPVSEKLALLLGVVVLALGFLLFWLPRYLEIKNLENQYPKVLGDLKASYDDYTLQVKNYEKLKAALSKSVDYEYIENELKETFTISRNNDEIFVSGKTGLKELYDFLNLILGSSNLRLEELHIQNKFAIPVIVFPLKSSPSIEITAKIKYMEVRK